LNDVCGVGHSGHYASYVAVGAELGVALVSDPEGDVVACGQHNELVVARVCTRALGESGGFSSLEEPGKLCGEGLTLVFIVG